MLSQKISKRIRLCIVYRLAKIDEKAGDIASAREKYTEVAVHGNKLWIAAQAKDCLDKI
ncbi:hypothetical protein [Petroclostridium sp. X23]|uniref:hypothetical protein n=1 Tax=Petroclostridium sp. X23 TaxID=3045146 RepID=UPI0024ADE678|nr:hypothetical protein [Petroclostridium sp. X23]WHH60795.1 hypothetical protein QKW49_08890 [Petroclostridium sp. X23]